MRALRTPMTAAALWEEEADEDAHYTFQNRSGSTDDDDDEQPPPRVYIAGPPSLTFPLSEGWSPANPHPDPHYAISKLAQLSIKRLTKLYTHHAIETKPPNC